MFDHSPAPTRTSRRTQLRSAILRPILTTALLLALYFFVPLDNMNDLRRWLLLVGAICVFGAVTAWEFSRILRSRYPVQQAVETIATVLPLYLLGFSILYYLLAAVNPGSFSTSLSRMASLYFTVTVFSTVGFGDISALSDTGRAVVTIQMITNLALLGIGGKVLYGAIERSRERQAPAGPA
ncbi:MAG: two pore domain potassium channel family protein [Rhodococcus sp. (in: high G+C Gram-positive bacteria)]|nr:MAG: two pore domain potassium channel family protein [Rhodococcus sp. (in: high G+C Gram-positive bacteria)]